MWSSGGGAACTLLTTLLLAQGTPMLLAGDERGHSQHGNNNAYCQDNPLTWLNWQQDDFGLVDFTAALIRLRQHIPALTQDSWWQEGDGNVQWLNASGKPLERDEWERGDAQTADPALRPLVTNDKRHGFGE